jgi:hypothetical protein
VRINETGTKPNTAIASDPRHSSSYEQALRPVNSLLKLSKITETREVQKRLNNQSVIKFKLAVSGLKHTQ